MPELDKLYEAIKNDPNYSMGSQEEFVNKFSDSTSLKKLHGVLAQDGKYDVLEWGGFYAKFGVKKKDTPSQAASMDSSTGVQESPKGLSDDRQTTQQAIVDAPKKLSEPLSPQSDATPPLEGETSPYAPYDPMDQEMGLPPSDATHTEKPITEPLDRDDLAPDLSTDLEVEKYIPEMTVQDYLERNNVTEAEMENPDFKNMFKQGEGEDAPLSFDKKLMKSDVEAADIILEQQRLGKSVRERGAEATPALKAWVDKYPFMAPLVNFEQAVGRETNRIVFSTLSGAQKMFYKGIGSLMEATGIPGVAEKGAEIVTQQDESENWFKQAENYIEKSFDENWPEPDRNNAASRLTYNLGALVPFMGSLYLTPNPSIAGQKMALPINFAAQNLLQTYDETGDIGQAVSQGMMGAGEGMLIHGMGYGSQMAGQAVVKKLMGKGVTPGTSGLVGATTAAATMTGAGAAHSVANQLAHTGDVDWQQVGDDALMWFAFGVPGMLSAATSAYKQAPKETVNMAREMKVDIERLRDKAIELEIEAASMPNGKAKAERLLAASQMHKFADLKFIDNMVGKDPQRAIQEIKKNESLSEGEKANIISKIEESSVAQRISEARQKTAEKAPEKPSEPLSPKSDTQVPLKKESVSEAPKQTPAETRVRELMTEYNKKETTPERKKEIGETFANEYMKDATVSSAEKSRIAKEKLEAGEFAELRELMARPADKIAEIPKPTESIKENKQSLEAINERLKTRSEQLQSAKTEGDKLLIGNEVNELRTAKRKLERKIEKQDATKEPVTEKLPVEDKPKVSEKARETDAKVGTEKPTAKEVAKEPTEKQKYLAEAAQERVSISAPEFNAKAEKLRKRLEDQKSDDATKRKSVDAFLQANQSKINEAGLRASEVRALAKARTWKQITNALRKVQDAIEKNTPKMRAAAMEDFIRANKGQLGGLSPRATDALLKRVNRASESDAKLNQAQAYVEELMARKGVRETLEQQAKTIAEIEKATSPKTLLEKGGRGGKKPIVKRIMRTKGGEITDRLMEMNEWMNKGRSRQTPDVPKAREALIRELNEINNSKMLDAESAKREVAIKDRLKEMELADVDLLSPEQLKQIKQHVDKLKADGKSQSMAEVEARIIERQGITGELMPEVLGEKGAVPRTFAVDRARLSTDKSFVWLEASWQSGLSKIAAKGTGVSSSRVFSDAFNRLLTDKHVHPAETKMQEHTTRMANEFEGALKDAFGKSSTGAKKLIDALDTKVEITLREGDGRMITETINQRQALEKWLQLRDPELYVDLMRPLNEKGNGFTDKTITQINDGLPADMKKLGEWMYKNQKIWGKDVYNPVYRRVNGIDIAHFERGYWPSAKDMAQAGTAGMFGQISVQPGVLQSRTYRRTGVKAPIEYTDVVNTYQNYVNEAARYNAWAEPHKELSYILRSPEMRKAIAYSQGRRANQHIDFYLDKFAGRSERQTLDVLDYMTNALGGGILGFKPMVGIKQTFSSAYFLLDMPPDALAKGAVRSMQKGTMEYEVSRWLIEDPFVKARKDAFLQRDIASAQSYYGYMEGASKTHNAALKLLAKAKVDINANTQGVKKAQNSFIRVGDKAPITKAGAAYLAYKYKTYSGKTLTNQILADHISGKKVNENLSQAKVDWLMQASMTQQSVRESNVSRFRSSGSIQRAVTQFTSGQAQLWRVEMDAIRNFQKAQRAGDKKGMLNATRNFMISHALSGFIFGMANVKFKVEGNEKEILLSVLKGNLSGLAVAGRAFDYTYNKILNKPWADRSLTSFPAADAVMTTGRAVELVLREQKKDNPDQEKMEEQARIILENILTLNGIAVKGGTDIVEGYKRLIQQESNYPLHDVLGIGEPYEPDQGKSVLNE